MSRAASIYLDANATTPPLPEIVSAMVEVMRSGAANPASAHAAGAAARRIVERARDRVCDLIVGAEPEDVIFVSGGTEANNTVLQGLTRDMRSAFLVAPVEHPSVLKPLAEADANGRVRWLPVDSCGRVAPEEVAKIARNAGGRAVLAIQAVNGETGVVQPVFEIVQRLRSACADAFVLLDGAQAVGRIPIDLDQLDVDALSFSGHKLHGPAGIGALILRSDAARRLSPLMLGGGQERGMRSGTLNVPAIAGLAVALELRTRSFREAVQTLAGLRDGFEGELRARLGNRICVNGAAATRVANTSNVRFEGVEGMRLLALLDAQGIMASQGSACSSGRPEPSATLRAMGLAPHDAVSSLRFSFSILNTHDEAVTAATTAASLAQDIAA